MRPWSRVTDEEYRGLEVRAHSLLADVPLQDAWRVDLPGGGPSRTMEDVRSVFQSARMSLPLSLPVRSLFAIRRILGLLFRWDDPVPDPDEWSFLARLTEADREQSIIEPGTLDGPFAVLYVHATEAVSEIRNATVHAFLVWALVQVPDSYQLFWAIHVLPVSLWTKPYIALIGPFRRWLVYPSLLRRFHEAWSGEFESSD